VFKRPYSNSISYMARLLKPSAIFSHRAFMVYHPNYAFITANLCYLNGQICSQLTDRFLDSNHLFSIILPLLKLHRGVASKVSRDFNYNF
jgi:hypothetical protein